MVVNTEITITVEDGTGVDNANSYIDLDFIKNRALDVGQDISDKTDEQLKAAIIRATDYMDNHLTWLGFKRFTRYSTEGSQTLEWPRQGMVDRDGSLVEYDEIPDEVKRATADLALYEADNPEGLSPIWDGGSRVSRLAAGGATIEFDTSFGRTASEFRPFLTKITGLLSPYLSNVASISGTSNR